MARTEKRRGLKLWEQRRRLLQASKEDTVATAPPATQGAAIEIDSLFSQLRSAAPAAKGLLNSGRAVQGKRGSPELKGDGLFRLRDPDVDMSDEQFFESIRSPQPRHKPLSKGKASLRLRAEEGKRRGDGVGRILTEDELMLLTSKNAAAGTTPNCPFDCDCCF